jgi:ABC-type transport system involved in cytochrome bd biosynthesis fused ATPase/permease subunit
MSPLAFVIIIIITVIIIIVVIIIIIVNQTHAAQYFFRNLSTTSQHFMGFKLNNFSPTRTRHLSPFSVN